MKRTITTISLLSALLLAASTAYAQENITLDRVWNTVQGMQADFTIFALELRRANDRLTIVETSLDELTPDLVLIDRQRCLLNINNTPHTETIAKYIETYGSEPPVMEFLILQSIYYDIRTDEIILHFKDSWSDLERYGYEFWNQCALSRPSEWRDQPQLPLYYPPPYPRPHPRPTSTPKPRSNP